MGLDYLKEKDNLRKFLLGEHECYLHDDHRWVLPIILYEQQKGTLSRPCTLVMFDQHHDSKVPNCINEIRQLRKSGFRLEDLISICKDRLSPNDDDWVRAGMELGLIGHAVIFGVQEKENINPISQFEDDKGDTHKTALLGLPGTELGNQGCLSDLCKKDTLSDIWSILDWQFIPNKGFTFGNDVKNILLDFDLDCFVIRWRDYVFPWIDEVFQKEFLTPIDYWRTQGWTGKKFLDELVSRSGLITIAREPNFCGGDLKADKVLDNVNHFLFDERLIACR